MRLEGFGIELVLAPLKQRQMELFVSKLGDERSMNAVVYHGAVVRAAVLAGWIAEPAWAVEDVDELEPLCVAWVAEQVGLAWKRVMEPDPKV